MLVEITRWTRADRPQGRRYTITAAQLATMLSAPVDAASKMELPGYALVAFDGDYRAKSRIRTVYGSGVDIDGGATIEVVVAAFEHLRGHVYSTPSSTPDAPRFRVLLPYAEPLHDVRDAERVTLAMQRRAPGKVDTGTKDASRLWFPGWSGAAHFVYAPLNGEPLDAHATAAAERQREELARATRRFAPAPVTDGSYAERALQRACSNIADASEGSRHELLAREAWSIGTLVGAGLLAHHTAYAALDDASRRVFPDNRDDERLRTLDGQLAEGEKSPRQIRRSPWGA